MICYRIQDKQGRGPFKPGMPRFWADDTLPDTELKPVFEEFGWDFAKGVLYGESCGVACNSIAQLRRWFSAQEYRRLDELGYRVAEVKADRVLHESKVQMVITRAKPFNTGVRLFRCIKIHTP